MTSLLPSYLRAHRKRWALSQRQLAHLLGVSAPSTISRYENLQLKPPAEFLMGCEVIFGIGPRQSMPALYGKIEEDVMRRAAELYTALEHRDDPTSLRAIELIDVMRSRAADAPNEP